MPPRPTADHSSRTTALPCILRAVINFTIAAEMDAGRLLSPESDSEARRECTKGGAVVVHYIALELPGIRLPDETAKLEAAIKSLGDAYQFQKFAWIVEAEVSNTEISERLVKVLRPTDKLLVMRIHKDWVAANVPQPELDWLSGRNYSGVGDPPLFRR
jgi:hypothetical protein